LQRPAPLIKSFFPSFVIFSQRSTEAPRRFAKIAAVMPAAPPPTTITS